jgi:hypothetical protein
MAGAPPPSVDRYRQRFNGGLLEQPEPQGLLDMIRGGVQGATTGLLGGPVDLAAMAMRPFGYATEEPVAGSEWWRDRLQDVGAYGPRTGTPEEGIGELVGAIAAPGPDPAAMGLLGMGAIKAYHGSPHTFDKFSLEHIGKGEGAQAYGHGLYFAENPDVAKSYQFAGQPAYMNQNIQRIAQDAYDQAAAAGGDDVIAGTRSILWDKYTNETDAFAKRHLQDAYNNVNDLVGGKAGNAYTVNLDVEPDDLLDWDKPLSRQPEKVRKALETSGLTPSVDATGSEYLNSLPENAREIARRMINGSERDRIGSVAAKDWATLEELAPDIDHNAIHDIAAELGAGKVGADLYEELGDPSAAAAALRQLGIPGIRYLDGGSRGKGEGSSNFVMFDDALVDILERNGQPVAKAAEPALDMSQDARMARAAEQGFTGPYYHGTTGDFPAFDPTKSTDLGMHFGTPEQANTAGANILTRQYDDGANVVPVMLRSDKTARVKDIFNVVGQTYQGKAKALTLGSELQFNNADRAALYAAAKDADKASKKMGGDWGRMSADEKTIAAFDDASQRFYDVLGQAAKNQGVDALKYTNKVEGKADSIAVLDPSQVRSVHAAFDPKKRHSADLLASIAAGGLLGAGMAPRMWRGEDEPR